MRSPYLIADIGATKCRCALLDRPADAPHSIRVLRNESFPGLGAALSSYLGQVCPDRAPSHAVLAIAGPLDGDRVQFTNQGWDFSIAELQSELQLTRLEVINDFTALAYALPWLETHETLQIGGGKAVDNRPLAVLGPGSGLGVSGLIPTDGAWTAISGEGGHVSLAPYDAAEAELIEILRQRYGHCSAERVLSGPGLVALYRALCVLHGEQPGSPTPEEVSSSARRGDGLALQTLATFFSLLGNVAGNLALTLGARGGVYIGGGIVPELQQELRDSLFRMRFVSKGRSQTYLQQVPTFLITSETPAFRDCNTCSAGRSNASHPLDHPVSLFLHDRVELKRASKDV